MEKLIKNVTDARIWMSVATKKMIETLVVPCLCHLCVCKEFSFKLIADQISSAGKPCVVLCEIIY